MVARRRHGLAGRSAALCVALVVLWPAVVQAATTVLGVEPLQLVNRTAKLSLEQSLDEGKRYSLVFELGVGRLFDEPQFGDSWLFEVGSQARIAVLGDFDDNVHVAAAWSWSSASSWQAMSADGPLQVLPGDRHATRYWRYGLMVGNKLTWRSGVSMTAQIGAMNAHFRSIEQDDGSSKTLDRWTLAAAWIIGYAW